MNNARCMQLGQAVLQLIFVFQFEKALLCNGTQRYQTTTTQNLWLFKTFRCLGLTVFLGTNLDDLVPASVLKIVRKKNLCKIVVDRMGLDKPTFFRINRIQCFPQGWMGFLTEALERTFVQVDLVDHGTLSRRFHHDARSTGRQNAHLK